MQTTLQVIRELTGVGDSLMWIVGPGHMVSENTSRGIREPQVEGEQITVAADDWRFHLDAGLVSGIQFVETYGDLTSYYVRFSDREGETLLRAYLPKGGAGENEGESQDGNATFEEMRSRYEGSTGVEYVLREVLMSSFRRRGCAHFIAEEGQGKQRPTVAGIRLRGRWPRVGGRPHSLPSGEEALAPSKGAGAKKAPAGLVGLRYPWWRIVLGLAVLAVAAIFAASLGSVHVPFLSVVEIVWARLPGVELSTDIPPAWDTIMWKLRLPRVAQAAVVGAALAMSGAAYQGLFKNPLADPYLVGVASGAGLGAVVVLLTGIPMYLAGISLLPVAAFAGGAGAVVVAYSIARNSQGTPTTTLILAGVAIASLTGAISSLLIMRSDPELRPVLAWLLGSFISSEWKESAIVLAYAVPGIVVLLGFGRVLNVLQLSEDHAAMLGVPVEKVKLLLIAAATLITAAAVSFSGLIGFVGLVAPHAVRLVWGPDYRFLLPMSAIVGATFLVLADLVARTIVSPGELPVGVVTAFCGAPFFLYLLRRRRLGTS